MQRPDKASRSRALVASKGGTDVTETALAGDVSQQIVDYWDRRAKASLDWQRDYHTVLDWQPPYAEWFVGGKLNVAENCIDRHVAAGLGDRVAYFWEGTNGDRRELTYSSLLERVMALANLLKVLGVERGDRVIVYLPRIPELPIAMLACARIGAVHSVVFSGLSSDALADRINDATATAVITADAGWLGDDMIPLKQRCDEALAGTSTVEHVIVVDRAGTDPPMKQGRDHRYEIATAEVAGNCPAEPIDSEELLYLLYTSGATAKPKGIMHTTGGYLTQVTSTFADTFAVEASDDVFFCGIDPAWAAGHSYGVYGPLSNGCTSLIHEGSLTVPSPDRIWELFGRYGVSHWYLTPATARLLMEHFPDGVSGHDLSALTTIALFGDTVHREIYDWLDQLTSGRARLINTWWQTETGALMAVGERTADEIHIRAIPGTDLDVESQQHAGPQELTGPLGIHQPWPAMLRGVWDQPKRYREDYWKSDDVCFTTGDYTRTTSRGLAVLGRVDDLISTPGGPIAPFDVEEALNGHPAVAESVLVSVDDDSLSHQLGVAFVTVTTGTEPSDELGTELAQHVEGELGSVARPRTVAFTEDLPRTDDGKLMRRLLRDVALGRDLGDTTTLLDTGLMSEIRQRASYPENWCWRDGPVEPGPVVIVDIDGTIADARARMEGIDTADNWLDHMVGVREDPLITEVAQLVNLLTEDVAVVMLSARPISIQDETREWLEQHGVRWDLMILRATSSMDKPLNYKQHRTSELRQHGFEPVLALEDDRRNVDMYHDEGVPCLYIHSGIHG